MRGLMIMVGGAWGLGPARCTLLPTPRTWTMIGPCLDPDDDRPSLAAAVGHRAGGSVTRVRGRMSTWRWSGTSTGRRDSEGWRVSGAGALHAELARSSDVAMSSATSVSCKSFWLAVILLRSAQSGSQRTQGAAGRRLREGSGCSWRPYIFG